MPDPVDHLAEPLATSTDSSSPLQAVRRGARLREGHRAARRSRARADDDRRPSLTAGGAGHAVAARPGGRARRRRGHRPRPLRGRARRRGARRDRLALPPDHRRPRPGRLRRHQPTDRLRRRATRGRSWSPRPGCPGSRKPSTSPPAPPWTPPRPCGSGSGPGPPSPPPSRHTCCTSWPPTTRPSPVPHLNPTRSPACPRWHLSSVQQVPSNRPAVQRPLPDALDATARPSPAPTSRPTVPSTDTEALSTSTAVTPARARARAAALRHATRHGSLPTVSALAAGRVPCGGVDPLAGGSAG